MGGTTEWKRYEKDGASSGEHIPGGHRTVVPTTRKRSLRLATGKILGYNDADYLPLVQET